MILLALFLIKNVSLLKKSYKKKYLSQFKILFLFRVIFWIFYHDSITIEKKRLWTLDDVPI